MPDLPIFASENSIPMKLFSVARKTRNELRFTPQMGRLDTKVTYIRKHLFGIPYRTLHKYRQTYYGEVKACTDCQLER